MTIAAYGAALTLSGSTTINHMAVNRNSPYRAGCLRRTFIVTAFCLKPPIFRSVIFYMSSG
jgi:hypothetical protein